MVRSTIATFNPGKSLVHAGASRGFVVEARDPLRQRYIITAAHCLPRLPDIQDEWPGVFRDVLGPLGSATTSCAECLYVDPISDIAVLGTPDAEELPDQAEVRCASRPAYPTKGR
jgi:hypothetical protein